MEALPGISGEDTLLVKDGDVAGGGPFGKDCVVTGTGDVSCTYSGVVQPDDTLVLTIPCSCHGRRVGDQRGAR